MLTILKTKVFISPVVHVELCSEADKPSHAALLKNARSELTKIKKKVSEGYCPECHRNFAALERHMKCKHPAYAKEELIGAIV
jgi:hypothetical protein